MVNNPLIRPYFLGGWHRGVPLDSHDIRIPGIKGGMSLSSIKRVDGPFIMCFDSSFLGELSTSP